MGREVGPSLSGTIADLSQSVAGYGRGRVFVVTWQEVQDFSGVVTGALELIVLEDKVSFDCGIIYSFGSLGFSHLISYKLRNSYCVTSDFNTV